MEKCMVCGNHYNQLLEIHRNGKKYLFDCFECAIDELAPTCKHCSCKIIGHGVEAEGEYYCCNHCVRQKDH